MIPPDLPIIPSALAIHPPWGRCLPLHPPGLSGHHSASRPPAPTGATLCQPYTAVRRRCSTEILYGCCPPRAGLSRRRSPPFRRWGQSALRPATPPCSPDGSSGSYPPYPSPRPLPLLAGWNCMPARFAVLLPLPPACLSPCLASFPLHPVSLRRLLPAFARSRLPRPRGPVLAVGAILASAWRCLLALVSLCSPMRRTFCFGYSLSLPPSVRGGPICPPRSRAPRCGGRRPLVCGPSAALVPAPWRRRRQSRPLPVRASADYPSSRSTTRYCFYRDFVPDEHVYVSFTVSLVCPLHDSNDLSAAGSPRL